MTIAFLCLTVYIHLRSQGKLDVFSKRIMYTYTIGYIFKTGCWIRYYIVSEKFKVDGSEILTSEDDIKLKQSELTITQAEDFVCMFFQIILYVFIFKIPIRITVYNFSRCSDVQELIEKNNKIYKVMQQEKVTILLSIINIILNFFMLGGIDSIASNDSLGQYEELFSVVFNNQAPCGKPTDYGLAHDLYFNPNNRLKLSLYMFIRMFHHFYQAKKKACSDQFRDFTLIHHLITGYVVFLVVVNILRSVAWAFLTQGFVLDEDSDNYTYEDFIRAIVNQIIGGFADFINGISIVMVIIFKNKDKIQRGSKKQSNADTDERELRFSDLMTRYPKSGNLSGRQESSQDVQSYSVYNKQGKILNNGSNNDSSPFQGRYNKSTYSINSQSDQDYHRLETAERDKLHKGERESEFSGNNNANRAVELKSNSTISSNELSSHQGSKMNQSYSSIVQLFFGVQYFMCQVQMEDFMLKWARIHNNNLLQKQQAA